MTTVCDPGAGLFRAMEDADADAAWREAEADRIRAALKYPDGYTRLRQDIEQRTTDWIYSDALGFVQAMQWAHNSSPYSHQKERVEAQIYLTKLAEELGKAVSEAIDEEIERGIEHHRKDGEY
jgi:hypothetical protein